MRDSQPRLPQRKKVAIGSIRQVFVAKNQCGCSVGEDLSGLSEVGFVLAGFTLDSPSQETR
jgi:hypothetical protein